MHGRIRPTVFIAALTLAVFGMNAPAGAANPAPRSLPNRLIYVIPAGPEHTLEIVPPALRPQSEALRELFVAAVRGEILARFESFTVVQTTPAQDSLLAATLADRSLFNRYDNLVVARATLEGPGPDEAPGLVHARVAVAFRPWDPADTLTLTGQGEGGGSGESPELAARAALETAVRRAGEALARGKSRLVR